MTQRIRLNAASDPIAGGPEHIEKDGEDYLRVPIVAGQEQIYEYPDQPNAEDYEFLPGDELGSAVDRHNGGLTVVLDHPTASTPTGPTPSLLTQNAAQGADVDGAEYGSLEATDTKARGNLDLPESSRDEYGPAYREAYDALEDGETWPVSLGYSVGWLDRTNGEHNGDSYSGVQRDLTLDHLALVMNGRARCSVADGCAAGRANAEQEGGVPAAAFGEPLATTMSNQQPPERDKGAIAEALGTIGSAFGIGVSTDPRTNAEPKSVAGVTFTTTKGGTLDESAIPDDDFESHYLVTGDTKSDSSYPVVDGSGALRAGNVSSAWNMRGSGDDAAKSTLESKLKKLAGEFDDDPLPDDARENATQYDEGTVVEYGDGTGVVLAVMTSDFTWPQGDDDEVDVEVGDGETAYIVARESGGSQVFWGDELSEGSFDTEAPDEEELSELRSNSHQYYAEWYEHVDDSHDPDEVDSVMRGNANIPGVDDPGVGFDRLPEGWTRKSVLQAYISLGGSWTSCVAGMTGEIRSPKKFCSSLKDEVYQSERWRGRF